MLATDSADRLAGRSPRRGVLADGREILYFDDAGRDPGPPPPDPRDPEPRAEPAELRHDPLSDEPVLVATHRQTRTHLPSARDCPLCPSRDGTHTEIPATDYDVVAFENRFPSLPAVGPDGTAAGRCEVLCFSADHDASFGGLAAERLSTLTAAIVHRTLELEAMSGVRYVLAFENRGEEIGVTLHHPHGQVYAYPFLPPRVTRLLEVARRQRDCLGCRELDRELAGPRIIEATDEAVAYVPIAARWPYEAHVVPRRHVGALAELDPIERVAIVAMAARMQRRLDTVFGRATPSMTGWLTAPVEPREERWHLRILMLSPQRDVNKLKYLAGSESLGGAFINDVRPEEAAARLRDAR